MKFWQTTGSCFKPCFSHVPVGPMLGAKRRWLLNLFFSCFLAAEGLPMKMSDWNPSVRIWTQASYNTREIIKAVYISRMKQYNRLKRETCRSFQILYCSKYIHIYILDAYKMHPSFTAYTLMYDWARTKCACTQQGNSRPRYLQTNEARNNFWPISCPPPR